MKTLFLIAAACITLAATPAVSADYTWKPHITACKTGTLESWLRIHGHKFINGFEQAGPLLFGEITWTTNGKRQMVYVGPHGNDYCVLAAARPEID